MKCVSGCIIVGMAAGAGLVEGPGRLDFIEGMRGAAALYVMLQHFATMVDPYRSVFREGMHAAWFAWPMRPLWFGQLAVAAFIVISGFCLQLAAINRGDGSRVEPRRFFARRSWRILPPYYACLFLSLIVAVTVTSSQSGKPWNQYVPVTWESLLAHLFMLHNFDPAWMYKINGVLWSIAIEYQLYFLFPAILAIIWRWSGPVAVIGAVVVCAVLLALFPESIKLYVWYLPLFVLGAGAARYSLRPGASVGAWIGPISLLLLAGTIAACSFEPSGLTPGAEVLVRDALFGCAVAGALCVGVSNRTGLLARAFSMPWLVAVGMFSYSLYLIHHPIVQIVYLLRPNFADTMREQMAYLLFIGTPLILLVAWGFFLVFERPFVRKGSLGVSSKDTDVMCERKT